LGQEYARLIRDSRGRQLVIDRNAALHTLRLLDETVAGLRRDLQTGIARGIQGARYKRDIAASIERHADELRDKFKTLLNGGITAAAANATQRESGLLAALKAGKVVQPASLIHAVYDQGRIDVEFARVPAVVLDRLYERTFRDGLKLSQRLHNLDQDARKAIADEVYKGVAVGASSRKLAAAIETRLMAPGVDDVRYRAVRIARTEINTAYREGHIAAATGADGKPKPWLSGVGWRLSPAHPRTDICDSWAGDDTEGLGAGNYSPDNVPPGHPHCLCYTVSILAALPDQQFVAKTPLPDEVPESQRKYYAAPKPADSSGGPPTGPQAP
jgi:hypothetical protein